MGYRLNRLDEPVLTAVSKTLLTKFGIHHRLESCDIFSPGVIDSLPPSPSDETPTKTRNKCQKKESTRSRFMREMMEDFDKADLDGDGNIDFSEYIKSHTAAPPPGGSTTISTRSGH